MTQTLPADEIEATKAPAAQRPGRLALRRRLIDRSIPVLVLLGVFAVKLASVGILGNRLPGQFADRDQAGMESTVGWIDVGNFGRGYREQLAVGDMIMLGGDLPAAHEQFKAAHEKEPAACPPRGKLRPDLGDPQRPRTQGRQLLQGAHHPGARCSGGQRRHLMFRDVNVHERGHPRIRQPDARTSFRTRWPR